MKKEGCQGPLTRESAEERINKGKNALQAPIRETINEDEFIQILEIVKHSSFVGARKKCAMIIMYLTGVRVIYIVSKIHHLILLMWYHSILG